MPPADQSNSVCDVVAGEQAKNCQGERTSCKVVHAVWQAWCKGVNLNQAKNDSPKEHERKCNPEVCIWRVEQTLLCWFEIRLAKPVDAQNRAKTEANCKPPEPFDMRECCEAQQANQQGE